MKEKSEGIKAGGPCAVSKKCGGCQFSGMAYKKQLSLKQKQMEELLGDFAPVEPVLGMKDPFYYRNKVHHVFGRDKKGNVLAGCYEAGSHRVVDIGECLIEDRKSQEIIRSIKGMLRSFKIRIYDEDTGYGLLRHVLVRRGFSTGEIMVVLVLSSPILPGKNNFVKALLKEHPEITTIILNVNDEDTSMVLGKVSKTIYGPGFIRDTLCGCSFRISPQSFYQVNPIQTEALYETALQFAGLIPDQNKSGTIRVIDAYCGIGTIGLAAAKAAPACSVTGIELNPDAVRDARLNAKENGIRNARFIVGDAGRYMEELADAGERAEKHSQKRGSKRSQQCAEDAERNTERDLSSCQRDQYSGTRSGGHGPQQDQSERQLIIQLKDMRCDPGARCHHKKLCDNTDSKILRTVKGAHNLFCTDRASCSKHNDHQHNTGQRQGKGMGSEEKRSETQAPHGRERCRQDQAYRHGYQHKGSQVMIDELVDRIKLFQYRISFNQQISIQRSPQPVSCSQ